MGIALVLATFALVVITAFYAWQTRRTVDEMRAQRLELRAQRDELKSQREEMARQEEHRRRDQVVTLRTALANELRQLLANIDGKRGTGRLLMRLPTQSWKAVLGHPEVLTDDLRENLFEIYDEVGRMNAIASMVLADMAAPTIDPSLTKFVNSSALGLERATSLDFLARKIRPVVAALEAQPLS